MVHPENMTLVLLREMRAENREAIAVLRAEMQEGLAKVNARLDRLEKRLDVMQQNGMKALRSFVGHRIIFRRTISLFDNPMSRLEQRVGALEEACPAGA